MESIKFIVGKKPPNWNTLEKEFRVKWENIVVTYGQCVYSEKPLSPDLIVHETIHTKQQGDTPDIWWERYIKDPIFRLEQELEAYIAQVKYVKKNIKDRNQRFRFIYQLAQDLSGSMYGNCISFNEAYKKITQGGL